MKRMIDEIHLTNEYLARDIAHLLEDERDEGPKLETEMYVDRVSNGEGPGLVTGVRLRVFEVC